MQGLEPRLDVLGLPQREAAAARGDAQFFHQRLRVRQHALHRGPLAPADRQPLGDPLQHDVPVRLLISAPGGAAFIPFKAADRRARHQAVAVHAHEAFGEFTLDVDQRLFDQVLSRVRAQRDVFQLGLEVNHVRDRHQRDAMALGHREELARAGVGLPCGVLQAIARRGAGGLRLFQRRGQALGAHRLHQVVERVQLERLDRMPVVRGDEDDDRRVLHAAQVTRHLDASHARHLDVEEQDLRAARGQALDHLQAVGRLARHAGGDLAAHVGEQLLQPVARRRLVVGNEHPQFGRRTHARPVRYGMTISTR